MKSINWAWFWAFNLVIGMGKFSEIFKCHLDDQVVQYIEFCCLLLCRMFLCQLMISWHAVVSYVEVDVMVASPFLPGATSFTMVLSQRRCIISLQLKDTFVYLLHLFLFHITSAFFMS